MSSEQIASLIDILIPLGIGLLAMFWPFILSRQDWNLPKNAKRKMLLMGAGFIMVISSGFRLAGNWDSLVSEPVIPTAELLQQIVVQGNLKLPKEIDAYTTFERMGSSGDTLISYFTLHGVDTSGLTPQRFSESMKPSVLAQISKQPNVSLFRDRGVILQCVYSNEDASFRATVTVSPDEY